MSLNFLNILLTRLIIILASLSVSDTVFGELCYFQVLGYESNLLPELEVLLTSEKTVLLSTSSQEDPTHTALQLSDVVFLERQDSILANLRAPWQRVGLLCLSLCYIHLYLQTGHSSGGVWAYLPVLYL